MTIFSLYITITCISKSNTPPQAAAIKHEAVIGEKTHEADKFKSESSEEPAGLLRKKPVLFLPGGGKHRQASEIGQNQGIQDGGYDRFGI